jgi:hypothetical protein
MLSLVLLTTGYDHDRVIVGHTITNHYLLTIAFVLLTPYSGTDTGVSSPEH